MKFLPSMLMYFFQSATTRRNVGRLLKFVAVLAIMVTVYSVLFHVLMEYEGRYFSWITGFYWTLVTMTTLGFGDITFTGDLGRVFSMVVLVSGVVFLLVMLPFTFIQFFYAPWLESQAKVRAPRELPEDTSGHVILTSCDPVSIALVAKLVQLQRPYAFLIPDLQQTLERYDQGYKVVLGARDDPETYRLLRADRAALIVATNDDLIGTNIAFTVREVSERVPIVTNAELEESVDILELAGSTHVFQFARMLGRGLARRVLGAGMRANVIGQFDQLLIAEASAMRTPLEGKSLAESRLREMTGITVVGVWERGRFAIPDPQTRIRAATVLLLAGSEEQLGRYDETIGAHSHAAAAAAAPVLILGGGRVGKAAAELLAERQIDYRIVEKDRQVLERGDKVVLGSAADLDTLVRAGIREAPSVIVTTHDDDLNIYLTIYCRRLRPDIQVISRATLDRNVGTLHRAGADLVISYASMGANAVLNVLRPNQELMLEEGLNVFRVAVHSDLAARTLGECRIREHTGCSVIAVKTDGRLSVNPDPSIRFKAGDELILIGTPEAEKQFVTQYPEGR
jgi:Trk K+ transport system NAD-binding subunit